MLTRLIFSTHKIERKLNGDHLRTKMFRTFDLTLKYIFERGVPDRPSQISKRITYTFFEYVYN